MRIAWKCVVLVAGLLAADLATSGSREAAPVHLQVDPRLLKLRSFFAEMNSPGYLYAEELLSASDRYGLDWRLLPSLSILESGGGREARNNNILGWDSCRQRFPSVAAGIHHVAYRLAESNAYRHRDLDEVLRTYNPHPGYPRRVKSLMARLDRD
jgi:hypothetical protein